MDTMISLLNYGLILIFGVLLTMYFAGVDSTQKNRLTTLLFMILMLVIQSISWASLGPEATRRIYPLITHLPLVVFVTLLHKKNWLVSFICVLSAYLCCQAPHWLAATALNLFDSRTAYHIINSLAIFPVLYLLKKYVAASVNQLMNSSKRSLLLFGIVPLMYYVFDYATTVYTDLLYRGVEVVVQFMPLLVSMFYFVFSILYYKEMQRRSNAENESMLMTIQINQAKRELDALSEAQEKTAIYRHDMRHHLNLIGGLLTDGDIPGAIEYICQTQSDIDKITPFRYCCNNTMNLILSFFAGRAKANGINFTAEVQLPQNISIEETELCALLSNGLENAVNACAEVTEEGLRRLHINCQTHKGNLLIFIENSFNGNILIDNGLLRSEHQGHGYGMKSIMMITRKYNGYCSYTAQDHTFTLRIVLPYVLSKSEDLTVTAAAPSESN